MTPDAESELKRILSQLHNQREASEIIVFRVRVVRLTIQKQKMEK